MVFFFLHTATLKPKIKIKKKGKKLKTCIADIQAEAAVDRQTDRQTNIGCKYYFKCDIQTKDPQKKIKEKRQIFLIAITSKQIMALKEKNTHTHTNTRNTNNTNEATNIDEIQRIANVVVQTKRSRKSNSQAHKKQIIHKCKSYSARTGTHTSKCNTIMKINI